MRIVGRLGPDDGVNERGVQTVQEGSLEDCLMQRQGGKSRPETAERLPFTKRSIARIGRDVGIMDHAILVDKLVDRVLSRFFAKVAHKRLASRACEVCRTSLRNRLGSGAT